MQNSITLLGSTGSIGTQTLDVVRNLSLTVESLSARSSARLLADQCREFKPVSVCIGEDKYSEFKLAVNDMNINILCGDDGLKELASEDESETLVNAVLGMKGLLPTIAAAEKGKKIAEGSYKGMTFNQMRLNLWHFFRSIMYQIEEPSCSHAVGGFLFTCVSKLFEKDFRTINSTWCGEIEL